MLFTIISLCVLYVQNFYDLDANLTRVDVAARFVDPEGSGTLTFVQNINLKLQYNLYRQYRNCTVTPLPTSGNVYVGPDGCAHVLDSNHFFYLVNTSNFNYEGRSNVHGVLLDDWMLTGNFSSGNEHYTNTTVRLSVLQPGWTNPSISSVDTNPKPWRISVDGTVEVAGNVLNVSYVSRFFDLSFEKPGFDVFDISDCVDPKDSATVSLAVPKGSGDVDYDGYSGNVRQAIVDYTKLLPIQVGRIEVCIIVTHII